MPSFTDQGYILVKNAVSKDIIKNINNKIAFILNKNTKVNDADQFLTEYFVKENLNFYEELLPVFNFLLYKDFRKNIAIA